jgi:hypothetical protein
MMVKCDDAKMQTILRLWWYWRWSCDDAYTLMYLRAVLFLIEGPRSRCYGRTTTLKAYCATLWGRWWGFCYFYFVMEQQWNEIDREKPKYSERNLSQCHCPPQIPHGPNRDRTRASTVRGRRLTAWAMARPPKSS